MADQKDAGVRVTASRAAALAAAQTLLQQEGPAAVTHQRVAVAAGVGRATVYRHWPKPEALLHEALGRVEMPFFTDFDSDLRRWLLGNLRRLAEELAVPNLRRLTATLLQTAQRDTIARTQLNRWLHAVSRRLNTALNAAAAQGEIDPPADSSEITAQLLGPLVFRTIFQNETASDELLDQVVSSALPWREPVSSKPNVEGLEASSARPPSGTATSPS